ncbi:MAG: alcohol dehydrogenase catalytic domain-containing protein [Pyrinomonadaceae bacterium]|nr:alcohol dehydrogenase catalytic domain-containing protein [Pyrinomonadaceae bacterium]
MKASVAPLHSTSMMRASVLRDVARMEVCDVPRPVAGPRDVLVRVMAVGLCGTDFHIFAGHANYHTDGRGRTVPFDEHPQILGHEVVGVVEDVGAEVEDLRAGNAVVLDQGLNCHSQARNEACEYCKTGDSHQCQYYGEHGITGLPGGLADYIAIPAVNAVRIDTELNHSEAALTEPLGCIVHSSDAVQRAHARYAVNAEDTARRVRSILICGGGPAGLLFVQYLRVVLGYDGRLLVSEPNQRKRELISQFGAETIDPKAVDLVDAVQEMTRGRRIEYFIDAAGAAGVFTQLPGLLRKQATVLLYGHGHTGVDLGVMNNIQFMEPTLVAPVGASGGFDTDGRPSTYRRALRLIEDGNINVRSMITHHYQSLEQVPDAFANSDHRQSDYVKGVFAIQWQS